MSETASNLPPLRFDSVQGSSIQVSSDGRTVRRFGGQSDNTVAFSTRPVKVNEKICFRFLEMTGSIRFGFTSNDPGILHVPGTASGFFNSPGYWSKQLSRPRFCKIDNFWYFYVNSSGDVHIARNGRDERVYFSKVCANSPLWAIIAIGEGTALQFVEPTTVRVGPPAQRTPQELVMTTAADVACGTEPIRFHDVYVGLIKFNEGGFVAQNVDHHNVTIVYSDRPVWVNEMICLSFVNINYRSIVFGFTKNDPTTGELLDGYWLESLEIDFYKQGNILHFYYNSSGDMQYGINGKDMELLCLGIDTSVPLWAVVKFYPQNTIKLIDRLDVLHRWVSEEDKETDVAVTFDQLPVISPQSHDRTMNEGTFGEQNIEPSRQQNPRAAVNRNQQHVPTTSRPVSNDNESVRWSQRPANIAFTSSQNQLQNSASCLRFHRIHGANVEVSHDGSTVRRNQEEGIDGIAYSDRPISVNEVVAFRIMETTSEIAFGFSRNNPVIHSVPNTVSFLFCPPPGYWVSALGPRFYKRDSIWYYYVNSSGDVHIGVHGRDVRVYFSALYCDSPLWAFVEICGDTVLKLVDPKCVIVGPPAQRTPQDLVQTVTRAEAETALGFHEVHGEQLRVSDDGYILQCPSSRHIAKNIAFSNRPIKINEMVHILFIDVGHPLNFIAFGFTKHNPANLNSDSLPDFISSEEDNNISGYWAEYLEQEICIPDNMLHFHVNSSGNIQYGVNGTDMGIFCLGVETRNPLWAVVQIRPNNSTIRFLDPLEAMLQNLHVSSDEDTDIEQNQAAYQQQSTNVEIPTAPPEEILDQHIPTTSQHETTSDDTECILCTELPANIAFVTCGHICTCYECAVKQWRGPGNGLCPVCRTEIQQILRTYR